MKYCECSLAHCWRSYSFEQDLGYSGNVVEGRWFLKRSKRSHLRQDMTNILEQSVRPKASLFHWVLSLTPIYTQGSTLLPPGALGTPPPPPPPPTLPQRIPCVEVVHKVLTYFGIGLERGPAVSLTLTLNPWYLVLTLKCEEQQRQTWLKSLMWKGAVFEVKLFTSPSSNHSSVLRQTIRQSIQLNSLRCFLLWRHDVVLRTWILRSIFPGNSSKSDAFPTSPCCDCRTCTSAATLQGVLWLWQHPLFRICLGWMNEWMN